MEDVITRFKNVRATVERVARHQGFSFGKFVRVCSNHPAVIEYLSIKLLVNSASGLVNMTNN